jgi:nicotinamidase-related amidase/archaellum component FlaC
MKKAPERNPKFTEEYLHKLAVKAQEYQHYQLIRSRLKHGFKAPLGDLQGYNEDNLQEKLDVAIKNMQNKELELKNLNSREEKDQKMLAQLSLVLSYAENFKVNSATNRDWRIEPFPNGKSGGFIVAPNDLPAEQCAELHKVFNIIFNPTTNAFSWYEPAEVDPAKIKNNAEKIIQENSILPTNQVAYSNDAYVYLPPKESTPTSPYVPPKYIHPNEYIPPMFKPLGKHATNDAVDPVIIIEMPDGTLKVLGGRRPTGEAAFAGGMVEGSVRDKVQNACLQEILEELFGGSLFDGETSNSKLADKLCNSNPRDFNNNIEACLNEKEFAKLKELGLSTDIKKILKYGNKTDSENMSEKMAAIKQLLASKVASNAITQADMDHYYIRLKCQLYKHLLPEQYKILENFVYKELELQESVINQSDPRNTLLGHMGTSCLAGVFPISKLKELSEQCALQIKAGDDLERPGVMNIEEFIKNGYSDHPALLLNTLAREAKNLENTTQLEYFDKVINNRDQYVLQKLYARFDDLEDLLKNDQNAKESLASIAEEIEKGEKSPEEIIALIKVLEKDTCSRAYNLEHNLNILQKTINSLTDHAKIHELEKMLTDGRIAVQQYRSKMQNFEITDGLVDYSRDKVSEHSHKYKALAKSMKEISQALYENMPEPLPARPEWMVKEGKIAHLIVDYQEGFVSQKDELPVPGAEGIAKNINHLTGIAYRDGDLVFASYEQHPERYIPTRWDEGRKAIDQHGKESITQKIQPLPDAHKHDGGMCWGKHCCRGTKGACFSENMYLNPDIMSIVKGSEGEVHDYGAIYSLARGSLGVVEKMQDNGVSTITIEALAIDYCVAESIKQALAAGLNVVFVQKASKGIDPKSNTENPEEIAKHLVEYLTRGTSIAYYRKHMEEHKNNNSESFNNFINSHPHGSLSISTDGLETPKPIHHDLLNKLNETSNGMIIHKDYETSPRHKM